MLHYTLFLDPFLCFPCVFVFPVDIIERLNEKKVAHKS